MRVARFVGLMSAIALAAPAAMTRADNTDEHRIVSPPEIRWAPAPASLPRGAEAAVLYGNPGEEGLFALRLRLPAGYHIPPHTHPKPEVVTVISGTFRLGMGETADPSGGRPLPAGSFFALTPGMAHYAFASEETVIQLNSTGPWAITYVNPAHDPRRQAR